ncbi:MAG: efflux RND transporter permease subunit, partial [Candidatus Eremiobacteraeota bacterium]|nr:efflux RND transporter permease subunit [Candidatus Eremiobacteraeota bacterium]
MVVLTLLGIYSYTTLPASIFPDMTFARIDVVATIGDLPPDQVRVAVALPLDRAFQGLTSVTRVMTTSSQGNAEFIVEYDPKTNVQTDLQLVDQAISQTRGQLPPQTNVQAVIVNPNREPVVSYALVSNTVSQTILHELAQYTMAPQFYGISGLSRVLVTGGPEREYHITLDPGILSAHGLTAQDVEKAIADANTVTALGVSQQYYQRNVLVLDARITSVDAIKRVRVTGANHSSVAIDELGTVALGVAPPIDQIAFDAHHGVMMNFYGLPGADAVKMAAAVKAQAASMAARLPVGVTMHKYWDQTDLIVESQKSLRDAILIGALLAVLVIFLFLRNLRMTIVAAIEIPLAMAITIFVMGQLHETLNLMSVGGLAVAVGLIIDDAIVVIENIARNLHLHRGEPKREVIMLAVSELAAPMTASTITTVVVFIPLALLSGVSGFFFRALALTLSSALIVSLILALLVAPILARWLMKEESTQHEDTGFVANLLARYEPLLRWTLSHRPAVYGASVLVLIVTVVLLLRLPSDFLPKLDEGQFEISYTMPVGSTLAASDAAATVMEKIVLQDPAVVSDGRLTGIDSNGFSPLPQNQGLIRVKLKPLSQRDGYDAIAERLRTRIGDAVPAAALDFHQILEDMINDLSGAPAPIEITLSGQDQNTLIALAGKITAKIKNVNGVADAFSGITYDDPSIHISPNLAQLGALGLTAGDLGGAVSAGSQGSVATSLSGPTNLVPVRVRVAGSPQDLASRLVATSVGTISLNNVAGVGKPKLSSNINEINGQRVVRLTANISGGSLSSVIAGIKSALRQLNLPPGYTTSIGGQYRAQQQSFKEFVTVILFAVALVFFVMLATFRSFRLPLVILTAIPLALIGVALALFITGTPFNVSSFMGLLLLVGIVVKNGILLIDVANQRRHAGD